MRLLTINGLEKHLVSGTRRFTLRVPELVVERGQFYGLVGKSGSGKSTLLDILALVSKPSVVDSFVFAPREQPSPPLDLVPEFASGRDELLSTVRRDHLGYVLQSGGLLGFLTTRQNLALPAQIAGRAPDWGMLESFADKLGILSEFEKKPAALSGGQRQRVSILRALSLKPALVLADEPTAAVDEAMAKTIVAELRDVAQEIGSAIIMVSHDVELVGSVADTIVELSVVSVTADSVTSECRFRRSP